MFKKILIIFTFLLLIILPAKADVMPYYVNNINPNSIGVYQAANNIKIYKEPNENSKLLLNIDWDSTSFNCTDVSASNLFAVFLPKKDLAFLTVVDENDNQDWVKIAYNQKSGNCLPLLTNGVSIEFSLHFPADHVAKAFQNSSYQQTKNLTLDIHL